MPAPSGFQKAKLESEGGVSLPCWFNPSEYSISKANDWTMTPIVGRSLPTMQFAGGHARELTLELLFDAAPDGNISSPTDVLFKMMETDPQLARPGRNQGRPPKVRFVWGTFLSFSAVCSDLSVRFVLFRPDGTPTRAISRLTLLQAEKDAGPAAAPPRPRRTRRPAPTPDSARTRPGRARPCSPSHTPTTEMPRGGAPSRAPTRSTTRCACRSTKHDDPAAGVVT